MMKIIAFVRLMRFKVLYSKWYENAFRLFVFAVFVWSVFGLARDMICSADGYLSLYYAVGIIFALFAIIKDVYSFVSQFHSKYRLITFGNRNDSNWPSFFQQLQSIDYDMIGFEVLKFKDQTGFIDFISYSRELNRQLSDGMTIRCELITPPAAWGIINQKINEGLVFLALKQKANAFRRFTNDTKIAIVGSNIRNGVVDSELRFNISKTCYYASYLRNEFHRDFVYDGVDQAVQLGGSEDWCPFVSVSGREVLADFDHQRNSYHIGVNTLGVTVDGYVCLWRQGNGNRSVGRVAPTGSGSMDWSDIKYKHGNIFNDAIIHGAERELREESFSRDIKRRLVELEKTGHSLKSSIIGLYRWGSLGGLPGFILVTLIPLKYSDITQLGRVAFGGDAECHLDTTNLDLNIGPGVICCGGRVKDRDSWRKLCANILSDFRASHLNQLSVPLFASLKVLEETLVLSDNFANKLYNFLEPSKT